MAPSGTYSVISEINKALNGQHPINRISTHVLIAACELTIQEIETALDYLQSRGALQSWKKTADFGGLNIEFITGGNYLATLGLIQNELGRSRFDAERNTLTLLGKQVHIGDDNFPSELIRTLFTEPFKEWPIDEIYEDWRYNEGDIEAAPKRRLYNAARSLNETIQKEISSVSDFVEYDLTTFRINPKYL